MSKFKHRLLIILPCTLAVILLAAYATGLLGVVIEAAIFRLKATWIYILVGGIGMYLIQYVAEKIYKR